MKQFFPALALLLIALSGCSMFTAWKSIPPPGGCDQCHTVEVAANWSVGYQPVALSNSQGQLPFQSPQYNTPIRSNQPASALELRKNEESRCFECHKSPNDKHTERTGRYHHR